MPRLYSNLLACAFIIIAMVVAMATSPKLTPPPVAEGQQLNKTSLKILKKKGKALSFVVEVATTKKEREVGLMFRTSLEEKAGMLFIFDKEDIVQMWMRNTQIPLDMVFINKQGRIASITENAVPQSLAIISSEVPVTSVLELAAGTVHKQGIEIGDKVEYAIANTH